MTWFDLAKKVGRIRFVRRQAKLRKNWLEWRLTVKHACCIQYEDDYKLVLDRKFNI